jgi:hypothetical protein
MADEPDDAAAGWKKAKRGIEKILASPFADREDLTRTLARELRETQPETAKMIAGLNRDGRLLASVFQSALNSTLGRTDLSDDQKREALDNAGDFIADLLTTREAPHGFVPADGAMEFALSALFAGMYSGLRLLTPPP